GWPSDDQPTASLAVQLDAGPTRRRVTHSLRESVRDSLIWADADGTDKRRSEALANAAVLAHAPTSSIRAISAAARESAGVWASIVRGQVSGRPAVTASSQQLLDFGRSLEGQVSAGERAEWQRWRSAPQEEEPEEKLPELQQEDGPEAVEDSDLEEDATAAAAAAPLAPLRPYQQAALDAVSTASPSNCCVVLPCGAGKTRVGSAITCQFLRENPNGCVVVLCLRREGMRQWARELSENWGTAALEVSGPISELGSALCKSQVILVTYHRLLSDKRRSDKTAGESAQSWEDDGIGEGGALDAAAGGAVAARFE
ncbi:unnamed protein product, partial [Polarella glacialis]